MLPPAVNGLTEHMYPGVFERPPEWDGHKMAVKPGTHPTFRRVQTFQDDRKGAQRSISTLRCSHEENVSLSTSTNFVYL